MKYCTKCGKQLLDDAIICVGCGCIVNPTPAQSSSAVKPKQATQLTKVVKKPNQPSARLLAFELVFTLAVFFTFFFLFLSMLYIDIDLVPDTGCLIVALVTSSLAFLVGFCSFVSTFVEELKGRWAIAGIQKFIIGIASLILSILFLFT